MMVTRRRFGSVRKRSSGRYQVRYLGPDGLGRVAPETFARKSDADRYLALIEVQILRSEWIDPARGEIKLQDYAERWVVQRAGLRPRTVELYSWLLGRHIVPLLGAMPLGRIDAAMVRDWRTTLLRNAVSITMAAKAYRLLRAIFTTAFDDEIVRRNPCRIKGADREETSERPALDVAEVLRLAEVVPEQYRALVLVTTFGCLRWGEVAALQRRDFDLTNGTLEVRQAVVQQRGVGLVVGPPKSKAGRRVVALPPFVVFAVTEHLAEHVKPGRDSFVFTNTAGRMLWRGNFNKLVNWRQMVADMGRPGLHFHDLRHTGNTLAARTGASLRDLMSRMGHDSAAAALIYQHASSAADRSIADALDAAITAHGQADQGVTGSGEEAS